MPMHAGCGARLLIVQSDELAASFTVLDGHRIHGITCTRSALLPGLVLAVHGDRHVQVSGLAWGLQQSDMCNQLPQLSLTVCRCCTWLRPLEGSWPSGGSQARTHRPL